MKDRGYILVDGIFIVIIVMMISLLSISYAVLKDNYNLHKANIFKNEDSIIDEYYQMNYSYEE